LSRERQSGYGTDVSRKSPLDGRGDGVTERGNETGLEQLGSTATSSRLQGKAIPFKGSLRGLWGEVVLGRGRFVRWRKGGRAVREPGQ